MNSPIPTYPSVYTIEPWMAEIDLAECRAINNDLIPHRRAYWQDYYDKHKDAKNKKALANYHRNNKLKKN